MVFGIYEDRFFSKIFQKTLVDNMFTDDLKPIASPSRIIGLTTWGKYFDELQVIFLDISVFPCKIYVFVIPL